MAQQQAAATTAPAPPPVQMPRRVDDPPVIPAPHVMMTTTAAKTTRTTPVAATNGDSLIIAIGTILRSVMSVATNEATSMGFNQVEPPTADRNSDDLWSIEKLIVHLKRKHPSSRSKGGSSSKRKPTKLPRSQNQVKNVPEGS